MNKIKMLSLFIILLIGNNILSGQSWHQCSSLPESMNPKTAIIGDKIYVFNNTQDFSKSINLYEYDIKNNSWKEKSKMSIQRYGFNIAALNGKLYAFGGVIDGNGTRSTGVEVYDPVSDKWLVKSSMPAIRDNFEICVYKNKIYVYSENKGNGTITDVIEVYDPVKDNWQMKTSNTGKATISVFESNAIFIINDIAYIPEDNKYKKYNLNTDKWSYTSSFEHPSIFPIVRVLVNNDELYSISNNRKDNVFTSYLDKYNPVTDTWTNLKNLPYHKMDFGFLPTGNQLFVIGGWKTNYKQAERTCEVYSIEKNLWKRLPDMSVPRVAMGIKIYNDSIFVLGGINGYKDDSNDKQDTARTICYSSVESISTSGK